MAESKSQNLETKSPIAETAAPIGVTVEYLHEGTVMSDHSKRSKKGSRETLPKDVAAHLQRIGVVKVISE